MHNRLRHISSHITLNKSTLSKLKKKHPALPLNNNINHSFSPKYVNVNAENALTSKIYDIIFFLNTYFF